MSTLCHLAFLIVLSSVCEMLPESLPLFLSQDPQKVEKVYHLLVTVTPGPMRGPVDVDAEVLGICQSLWGEGDRQEPGETIRICFDLSAGQRLARAACDAAPYRIQPKDHPSRRSWLRWHSPKPFCVLASPTSGLLQMWCLTLGTQNLIRRPRPRVGVTVSSAPKSRKSQYVTKDLCQT